MPPNADSCILTLNGGSSSIKFALFTPGNPPRRISNGKIEVDIRDQTPQRLSDELRRRFTGVKLLGIGHRVVHGGVHLVEHQTITSEVLDELRRSIPFDLSHLPGEIALIEAAGRQFPEVRQIACFDTAFHRHLPPVAQLLPIPRRFSDAGVRRLGFHGLSYTYLMDELRRVGNPDEADDRVILAHLGAGASLAALRNSKPIDTSMAFTPTAGLVMATRPGDLDPGLVMHMMRSEKLNPDQVDELLSHECGLLGIHGGTADMRELLSCRDSDPHAAAAVEIFCYQLRKWIGAFTAALEGLDTLVFSGGIGENSSAVRAEVCQKLGWLGMRIDPARNDAHAPTISTDDSQVLVRVVRTDEESVIANVVQDVLGT